MQNISVWFTRGLSEEEVGYARKAGIEPVVHPLITVRFYPVRQIIDRSGKLPEPDALAFTSKNGVDAFLTCRVVEAKWMNGIPQFCLGEKTAAMLLNNGFDPIISDHPTGGGLAEEMARHMPEGGKVLHFCGNLSRPETGEGLKKHGFEYHQLECYETIKLTGAGKPEEPLQAAVFYSPSAVEAYTESGLAVEPEMLYVAIGDTTAKALQQAGITDILTAPHPSTESIITTISTYFKDIR